MAETDNSSLFIVCGITEGQISTVLYTANQVVGNTSTGT